MALHPRSNWKRVLPIVLSVSIGTTSFIPFSTPVYADTAQSKIPVIIDGKSLSFDVPPTIVDNRVLVPLRTIFETLGAKVAWNPINRTVLATKGQTVLKIPIGSTTVYKNGQSIELDVPATIEQNRTLVPIRFVSEALGESVSWVNRSVLIQTPAIQTNSASAAGQNSQTQPQDQAQANIQVVAADSSITSQQLQSVQQIIQNADIANLLEKDLKQQFQQPVTIKVASNQQGYQASLLQDGISQSDVAAIADGSNGLALGNTIYFPLSENKKPSDLRNILAHELTHVLINQAGMGDVIPSWMNEGIAWTEGLKAEYQNAPAAVYQGQIAYMRETILDAFQTSNWQPLISDSEATIHSTDAYNVEWQDYFAVHLLQQTYGWDAVDAYLQDLQQQTPDQAFQSAFGVSQSAFEQTFDQQLAAKQQQVDKGMEITLQVSDQFHGDISILPVNSTVWKMYKVTGGTYTVDILPDGTVTGLSNTDGTALTPDSPDPNTVFVGIDPDQPALENGKLIARAGYALVTKYGQDYYLNSWTVDSNQQSAFDSDVSHLGIKLVNVQPLQN